jgi:hypothetical protein
VRVQKALDAAQPEPLAAPVEHVLCTLEPVQRIPLRVMDPDTDPEKCKRADVRDIGHSLTKRLSSMVNGEVYGLLRLPHPSATAEVLCITFHVRADGDVDLLLRAGTEQQVHDMLEATRGKL